MRHIFSALAFLSATLLAYGTNNDFGAEEDLTTKDFYYYSGDEKHILRHDSTKVVVFDFNNTTDVESCMEKISEQFHDAVFIKQIRDKKMVISTLEINTPYTIINKRKSNIKIWPCYIDKTGLKIAPNGYINVVLHKTEDAELLKKYANIYKCDFLGNYKDYPLWYVLRITSETEFSPLIIANLIYETGIFEYSKPDFSYFNAYEISYDPDVNKQWGLYNAEDSASDIDISEAWGYSTGRGVKIAIIDNGIDINHADLKHNMSISSFDAVYGKSPCTEFDAGGHGTHCAGIIAASRNNNLQICGVAPDAIILPIRVCLDEECGSVRQIVDAIEWAWKNGADIISCSWAATDDKLIRKAIDNALYQGRNGKGCIVIKSAGNKGKEDGEMTFPGNYNRDVISVGAIKSNGRIDEDSSYGEYMFVCAPGNNILSTMPDNKTGYGTGTSTAAPHVAGVAALILARNPSLTMKQVREIIGSNTNDISPESQTRKEFGMWDSRYGYGLVNALQCVKNTPRK